MKDQQGNDLSEDKVFKVREGLLCCWFCAPKSMPIEEVQRQVSQMFPAGTSSGWRVETDSDNPEPLLRSPGLCSEDCERHHWKALC